MKKMYVAINTINKATEFVQKASQVDGDVICTKGRYTIDGKSIMGVFSIDISYTIPRHGIAKSITLCKCRWHQSIVRGCLVL